MYILESSSSSTGSSSATWGVMPPILESALAMPSHSLTPTLPAPANFPHPPRQTSPVRAVPTSPHACTCATHICMCEQTELGRPAQTMGGPLKSSELAAGGGGFGTLCGGCPAFGHLAALALESASQMSAPNTCTKNKYH